MHYMSRHLAAFQESTVNERTMIQSCILKFPKATDVAKTSNVD